MTHIEGLMRDAALEIDGLRDQNEILRAKTGVLDLIYDIFRGGFLSGAAGRGGQAMGVDLVYALKSAADEEKRREEASAASSESNPFADPEPWVAEAGEVAGEVTRQIVVESLRNEAKS